MAVEKVIATNRKARHDFEIIETSEAGLVLKGTEVKSLREGQVNFKDSYAAITRDEGWLIGCHIAPYHHGTIISAAALGWPWPASLTAALRTLTA